MRPWRICSPRRDACASSPRTTTRSHASSRCAHPLFHTPTYSSAVYLLTCLPTYVPAHVHTSLRARLYQGTYICTSVSSPTCSRPTLSRPFVSPSGAQPAGGALSHGLFSRRRHSRRHFPIQIPAWLVLQISRRPRGKARGSPKRDARAGEAPCMPACICMLAYVNA
eukprot:6172777-Pleurochrysis_carterae.AAC.4